METPHSIKAELRYVIKIKTYFTKKITANSEAEFECMGDNILSKNSAFANRDVFYQNFFKVLSK